MLLYNEAVKHTNQLGFKMQRKKNQVAKSEPWNKGRTQGQKAPFTKREVGLIKHILEVEGKLRDLTLFSVAVDTMLRSVDLLSLKVEDVTDAQGVVLEEFAIRQKKTGDGNLVTLGETTRKTLALWITESEKFPWEYLFTGRGSKDNPISRERYRNLVKEWATHARLDPKRFSTHSLRRTKAAAVFQVTNNVEVVRELLGHSSVSSTSAYLNIGKKKALEIARKVEM